MSTLPSPSASTSPLVSASASTRVNALAPEPSGASALRSSLVHDVMRQRPEPTPRSTPIWPPLKPPPLWQQSSTKMYFNASDSPGRSVDCLVRDGGRAEAIAARVARAEVEVALALGAAAVAGVVEQQVLAARGLAEELLDGVEHLALRAVDQGADIVRRKQPGLRVRERAVSGTSLAGPWRRRSVRVLREGAVADQQGLVARIDGHGGAALTCWRPLKISRKVASETLRASTV